MVRKHPLSAMLLVWTMDAVALALMAYAMPGLATVAPSDWAAFALWTLILLLAHFARIELVNTKVNTGWSIAVDFAAALLLPFPLFCLTMLTWYGTTVIKRLKDRHPEPLIGPDFNAANVTLGAAVAIAVQDRAAALLGTGSFGVVVALLLASLAFVLSQLSCLTALLKLDLRKPWSEVGSLQLETLAADATMVSAGALLAFMYQTNPFVLILMVVPLLLLHRMVGRLNEARMAYIDGKTGLYNYRHFDEALDAAFARAVQSGKPLALVFGDMDHLREVNNSFGHLAGDTALVAVAQAFRESGIPHAVACRFGGEEFVLMIAGQDKYQAFAVAERVRERIASTRVRLECGKELTVTTSFGVAAFPEDAATVQDLVKAADEAVYEAKRAGRNRVCLYRRPPSTAMSS